MNMNLIENAVILISGAGDNSQTNNYTFLQQNESPEKERKWGDFVKFFSETILSDKWCARSPSNSNLISSAIRSIRKHLL